MPIQAEILGAGGGAALAQAVAGTRSLTVTAAGVAQATATSIPSAVSVVTTSTEAAGGVVLVAKDVGDSFVVINATSNNLRVYPPVGGAINGATTNAPAVLGANRGATFYQTGALNFGVTI
mgnify:CR=1 FL=1